MKPLEYYDVKAEQARIRSFQHKLEKAEKSDMAIQSAMAQHPVVKYVLNLPIEDPSYPANMYLRFANRVRKSDGALVTQENQESTLPSDIILVTPTGKETTAGKITRQLQEMVRNRITWDMPGHDQERPKNRGCGFITASDKTLVYTACPEDHHHHCKAKQRHCWSLRCPKCMNDSALKNAVNIAKRLLLYKGLSEKQGTRVGDVSHWVVSPPQEFMKSAMQSYGPYDDVCRYIEAQLVKHGATAGYNVFHPWRQTWKPGKGQYWALSPHFHCILYGRIDTDAFRAENPGWIIKKVHARQKIRSIRHTVAYLMTHMGLGYVDVEPEDVDWDRDFLDYMIPGIKSPNATYHDKDYENQLRGIGRMVGDFSDMDWEQWTIDRLYRDIRTRPWGGVSRKSIVNVDTYREYKIRVCRECGAALRTYDGFTDIEGQYVRYIADHPIVAFRNRAEMVRQFFLRYKSKIRSGEVSKAELAKLIPFALCSKELEIERTNPDLVMDGPFAEPDEYFLRRQRKAYGLEGGVVSA